MSNDARTAYLERFKSKYSSQQVCSLIDSLKSLKILVIGDTILDQYVFVKPKGRAVKDPILSTAYVYHEIYAGGILAIANHLSDFVSSINLVTVVGEISPKKEFIKDNLKSNITLKTFTKKGVETTIKKRFIDVQRNHKLFKVEYMNDKPPDSELVQEIDEYLGEELPKYDLVVVGDFGHGFISSSTRKVLEAKSRFLAVNAQSNSANMGYNYFTLYDNPDFFSLNDEELRLPVSMRFEPFDDVVGEVVQRLGKKRFLVTQSKEGCTFVNNGKMFKAPSVTDSVKDTVGAGDALFSIASLFACIDAGDELVPFMANCAGGIAVNIMGNKESITRKMLEGFVKEVLK